MGKRRGMMSWDALLGVAFASAMLGGLTTVLLQQQRVERRLSEQRAAVYQAEAILTRLQAGESWAAASAEAVNGVELRVLNDAPAPPGQQWVRVIVGEGSDVGPAGAWRGRASLAGLAPSAALPEAQREAMQ